MRIVLSLVLLVAAGFSAQSFALNQRVAGELEKLSPEEALEQRCDIEAMNRINDERSDLSPNKVIAYTFGAPKVAGTTIDAHGAVFRSRETWYHLSYHCETDSSELNIKDFSFEIGQAVPRSEWDENYLYP